MNVIKKNEYNSLCEDLEKINNRLTSSSYLEDRIKAIKDLKNITEKDPSVVGIYCMKALIESMKHFVHKNHFEIFIHVFKCCNGNEFQDIFF